MYINFFSNYDQLIKKAKKVLEEGNILGLLGCGCSCEHCKNCRQTQPTTSSGRGANTKPNSLYHRIILNYDTEEEDDEEN